MIYRMNQPNELDGVKSTVIARALLVRGLRLTLEHVKQNAAYYLFIGSLDSNGLNMSDWRFWALCLLFASLMIWRDSGKETK